MNDEDAKTEDATLYYKRFACAFADSIVVAATSFYVVSVRQDRSQVNKGRYLCFGVTRDHYLLRRTSPLSHGINEDSAF